METSDKKNQHIALAAEKMGSTLDAFRMWITQSWKIALMLTKGAYLLSERKALFKKLGQDVYYKIKKGEWQNSELDQTVNQIDRLSKKIELEELQIRNVRYGKKNRIVEDELDTTV